MNDLISRKAAIAEAYDVVIDGSVFKVVQVETIYGLPTIYPVKHGRWEKLYYRNYKCSCCGAWWTIDRDSTIKDFKYCPNCGTRMDL